MTNLTVLAYGLLGLPLAFAALPVYVHVPRFYAEHTGIALSLLGAILLGARLLDAFVDPWLGWWADRLPRRRMLAVALIPFALGFVALFNPPAGFTAVWLLVSLGLTYFGYSAASVAYQSWGAVVGENTAMRTRLVAAREGFGLAGVVLAAALPALLADAPDAGTARLAWVLPPLLGAAVAIAFAQVGPGASLPPAAGSPWQSLGRALADGAFRRLLGVFVANGIAAALPATLFLFFVADVIGRSEAGGPLLALYFVAGAVALPLWVGLASRIGRVRAWALALAMAMLSFGGACTLGHGDVGGFALICLASGVALGADLALPAAIAADLGERQGQPGACFGVWNMVAKINLALAAGLALPLLEWLGYRPGADGGGEALVFIYALLPLFFKLLAAMLLWRWRHFLEIRS
ncbi:MFS transporter [uncultured Propionivibrio sp.]|uniref:MFS transporter n=1 Tax=uncultured Propionivibrio sp. TaxID=426737 RepID=UPI0029BFFC3E|nr:MFS transporter [uncultured Propionivibrio sp.]